MARLPITMHGFRPALAVPNPLRVSRADLVRAAITVGKPPLAVSLTGQDLLAAPPRYAYMSLVWRALLVRTHLRVRGNRWVRTASYSALDPSEKSAVSYFLGNTQAKLTSEIVLGVPHLVHLDALLAALGTPTRRSRPDFIGCDATGRVTPVAIEAKGRTHGYTDDLVYRTKQQAQRVPAILGLPSPLTVASIAWFDRDVWQARLEDPPSKKAQAGVAHGDVVVASYIPTVAAILQAENEVVAGVRRAHLPEADLVISVPDAIAVALESAASGLIQSDRTSQLEVVKEALALSDGASRPTGSETEQRRSEAHVDTWTSTGLDGVTVELGDSWRDQGGPFAT